jgi:hypothetical protein
MYTTAADSSYPTRCVEHQDQGPGTRAVDERGDPASGEIGQDEHGQDIRRGCREDGVSEICGETSRWRNSNLEIGYSRRARSLLPEVEEGSKRLFPYQ